MKTKIEEMRMLAFRCQPTLVEALDLVARHNKISRSSVIRLLLLQTLRSNADALIPPKKNSKKPVDTKASA